MNRFLFFFFDVSFCSKGSVTLLAMIVLSVITITGLAFNSAVQSNIYQAYRFKIDEQALAIGDSIADIVKKSVEDLANQGKFDEKFKELEKKEKITIHDVHIMIKQGGSAYSSLMEELGGHDVHIVIKQGGSAYSSLMEESGVKENSVDIAAVTLTLEKDKQFPSRSPFRNDSGEIKGTASLDVEYSIGFKMLKKKGETISKSPAKKIVTGFEFKRVLVQPMVVRHFSFFVQNALKNSREEKAQDYSGGGFNTLEVDSNGNLTNPGSSYLVIKSGPEGSIDIKDSDYFQRTGYILLGTGGDQDKGIYLNLTAGSAQASESFHLYRGQKGESDFYKLFASDYSLIFNEDAKSEGEIKGTVSVLKNIYSATYDPEKPDPLSGVPWYYLARKDYGYASDWKNHPELGFSANKEIRANSLHLFGSGSDAEKNLTIVFGNVFRRCLSLSGYKQLKGKKKAGEKEFEVQAGPIYYYPDFASLHNHGLYYDSKITTRIDNQPVRENPAFWPVEVWDQRVNWKWNPSEKSPKLQGAWVFLSGDALMGRLVAPIAKLHENPQEAWQLFEKSVGMQLRDENGTKTKDVYEAVRNLVEKGKADPNKIVSPLIQAVWDCLDGTCSNEKGEFVPLLEKASSGNLKWTKEAQAQSAYLNELLLSFYFTSFEAYRHFGKKENVKDVTLDEMGSPYAKIVQDAAKRWVEIGEILGKEVDESKREYYRFLSYGASFEKSSRAWQEHKWGGDKGQEKDQVYYFTLPDPWRIFPQKEIGVDREVKERIQAENGHEKLGWNKVMPLLQGSKLKGEEYLFREYFQRLMTDPAWVLPYNYSLRFACEDLKEFYFRKELNSTKDRKDFLKELNPEIRDAVGLQDPGVNAYMKEAENKPLSPAIQKKILALPKDAKKQNGGYQFLSDLEGSPAKSLEELELDKLYQGRCMFSYETEDKFFKKRGNKEISLSHSVCIGGGIKLNDVRITGGGILFVDGLVHFKGEISAEGVVIVAKGFKAEGLVKIFGVSLISLERSVSFPFKEFKGNFVAKEFDKPVSFGGGMQTLNYDSGFLKKLEYKVGFQPFINTWAWKTKKDTEP